MRKAKTYEDVYAGVPTIIPKPKQSASQFRADMLLVDVIRICETDPGCGFRLKGSLRNEFYFLDDQWQVRSAVRPHAPMVASGAPGAYAATLSFWDAVLPTWRLVDLTKHPTFLQRIKESYVKQGVTERHYVAVGER